MTIEIGDESKVGMRSDAVVLFVQEMLIDLFGIVIPGFCFIILTIFSIGFALSDLLQEAGQAKHLATVYAFIENNTFISFIGIIMFSYVIGHFFFRQDPKYPDFASIRQLPDADLMSGCVRTREPVEGAQFPYQYLKEYLLERGFTDLAEYVHWSGANFGKDEESKKRTKHAINRFKLSIKEYRSPLFFDVIKNEAHIRLMSSMWYMAKASIVCSLFSILLLILINGVYYYWTRTAGVRYAESLAISSSILVCSVIMKLSIERFLHYQRVREIVFVLHAWHLTDLRNDVNKQIRANQAKKEVRI